MTLTNEVELVEKAHRINPTCRRSRHGESAGCQRLDYTALADTADTITALSEKVDGGSY